MDLNSKGFLQSPSEVLHLILCNKTNGVKLEHIKQNNPTPSIILRQLLKQESQKRSQLAKTRQVPTKKSTIRQYFLK